LNSTAAAKAAAVLFLALPSIGIAEFIAAPRAKTVFEEFSELRFFFGAAFL